MKFKLTFYAVFVMLFYLPDFGMAQFEIEWETSLGSSTSDYPGGFFETNDGGCIAVGMGYTADGDISDNNGFNDAWVIKLNASGSLEWEKNYGGSLNEIFSTVHQLNDGSFILSGHTFSNDGDIDENKGLWDVWLLKIDSVGTIQWNKTYGGTKVDKCNSLRITDDGGFILVGYSDSDDLDVSLNQGESDFWILKLDSEGEILWEKSYGGSGFEEATSVKQINDGGFVIVGHSTSADGDLTTNAGGNDFWLIEIDSVGNLEWQKSFGGSENDYCRSVIQAPDGGYIVAGTTNSTDGDVSGNYGGSDAWVLKLDDSGDLAWQKNYGGSADDNIWNIIPFSDGGVLFTGMTQSMDGDVNHNNGESDHWLVNLNSNGDLEWERTFGGSSNDRAVESIFTATGDLLVAGFSYSSDGDVSSNNGEADFWIYKLSTPTSIHPVISNEVSFSIYPNPSTGTAHISTKELKEPCKIELYNCFGQLVFKQNTATEAIRISGLDKGIYMVKISSGLWSQSRQLIVL